MFFNFIDRSEFCKLSKEDQEIVVNSYFKVISDNKEWLKALLFSLCLTISFVGFLFLVNFLGDLLDKL